LSCIFKLYYNLLKKFESRVDETKDAIRMRKSDPGKGGRIKIIVAWIADTSVRFIVDIDDCGNLN